jgi:Mg-chelatase subunit ChlD
MRKFILIIWLSVFQICLFGQVQTEVKPEEIQKPLAVSYGLLVDTSGSLRDILTNLLNASKIIIEANGKGDKTFVERFISKEKTSIVQTLTDNKDKLNDAVDGLYVEGGLSQISEALLFGAKHLVETETDSTRPKLLVVITDGDERQGSDSKKKMAETLTYLKDNKIKVLFLGIPSMADDEKEAIKFMNFFAEGTNGQVFTVSKKADWKSVIEGLTKAIHGK